MTNSKKAFWKFFKVLLPVLLLAALSCSFFWKVFIKKQVPLPADFVVGVYYPWLDYKWGFAAGVPVKNPITTDVVSFTFPMQMLAVDLIKSGQPPLWNPYILAGTPLLANFQSAPYSPTNLVYFMFERLTAWSIQIILQHILAAVFTFLLLRHFKVGKLGSALGGIAFAFSGYNLIWSQWNGHTLAGAFVPLILLFEDLWLKKGKLVWGLGVSLTLFMQIVSGYPQVVIYTGLAMFLLWLVGLCKEKVYVIRSVVLGAFLVLGLGFSAFQILPGAELLKLSQRAVEPHPFEWAFLPFSKVITFIAPDFFGNHATKNYWGPQDYTSNTGFVGVVAFSLATLSLAYIKKRKEIFFAAVLASAGLFFSFPTPISIFLWKSGFLGLNAASAHRALILFTLGVALLAGFGLDKLIESKKRNLWAIGVSALVLFSYGVWAGTLYWLSKSSPEIYEPLIRGIPKYIVALRNSVLPLAAFFATGIVFYIMPRVGLVRKVALGLFLFSVLVFELFRFGWKFTPFSPRGMVYPTTPVLDFLKEQQKPLRTTGAYVIPINMRMPYEIESLEGYDAVYPLRISQLIAAINSGKSGTDPVGRYGTVDNTGSNVLDLLNTKYHLTIKRNIKQDPDPKGEIPLGYQDQKFSLAFEDKSVAVLESEAALPRAKMFYNIKVLQGETEILDSLLGQDFVGSETIILEEEVSLGAKVKENATNDVSFKVYKETESVIDVSSSKEGILFVSDADYPGWKAYVDGVETRIYRANFAFRAVKVPEGKHEVRFVYRPDSFYKGLRLSGVSLLLGVGILAWDFVARAKRRSYTL